MTCGNDGTSVRSRAVTTAQEAVEDAEMALRTATRKARDKKEHVEDTRALLARAEKKSDAPSASVVDTLLVPSELPAGEYVLGWRYAALWSKAHGAAHGRPALTREPSDSRLVGGTARAPRRCGRIAPTSPSQLEV